MTLQAFDTHRAVKSLCNVGFDVGQAEALVDQINAAYNDNVATKADVATLATKDDLQDLKAAVATLATREDIQALKDELMANFASKTDLEGLEVRFKAEMAKQAAKYQRYLFAFAGIVVGLTKLLDFLID